MRGDVDRGPRRCAGKVVCRRCNTLTVGSTSECGALRWSRVALNKRKKNFSSSVFKNCFSNNSPAAERILKRLPALFALELPLGGVPLLHVKGHLDLLFELPVAELAGESLVVPGR